MTQSIAGGGQGTTSTRFIVFDHVGSVARIETGKKNGIPQWTQMYERSYTQVGRR
jgi:hypothetical protein